MGEVTTKDEYGNTVTKYEARIEQDAELHERVHGLEDEVTDAIAGLGELLARLRRLPLYALDGDDAAAEKALEALPDENDCCGVGPVVDEEVIDNLSAALDELEELVNGRTEQFERHVPGDQIEATVQDLIAAPVARGCEVEVIEPPFTSAVPPLRARIIFSRLGQYVTVRVHRLRDEAAERAALEAYIQEHGLEGTLDGLFQALVHAKGEATAGAIRRAVEQVAKGDPEKQIDLLRKAVAA